MNENTRVSVHCYEGDGHQVRNALSVYLHHGCPVTVLSPTDSRVVIKDVECRHAGQREGSVMVVETDTGPRTVTGGKLANARQRDQMKTLLEYPEKFFLMNDADSMCLSPAIPEYLYREPDVLWSNLVHDPLTFNQAGWYMGLPFIALQPPYFASREVIERLVSVADEVETNERIPWLDFYMLQLAVRAGVRIKGFRDSIASDIDRYPGNLQFAKTQVKYLGRVFVHSAKSPDAWGPLVEAHREWVKS